MLLYIFSGVIVLLSGLDLQDEMTSVQMCAINHLLPPHFITFIEIYYEPGTMIDIQYVLSDLTLASDWLS